MTLPRFLRETRCRVVPVMCLAIPRRPWGAFDDMHQIPVVDLVPIRTNYADVNDGHARHGVTWKHTAPSQGVGHSSDQEIT